MMMRAEPNSAGKIEKPARLLGAIAVAWILLDSMFTYFANHWFGFLPPVNALLIVILFMIVFAQGMHVILPPIHYFVVLMAGFFAFLAGKILTGQIDVFRLGEVVLSFVAFFIAYYAFRWSNHVETYAKIYLYVSLTYVAVCVVALLKILPNIFPVVDAVWSDNGIPVLRPEITTDQNFQIFYLFPIALVLALPFRLVRAGLVVMGVIGALFVLAKIQTRSGFLVFSGVVLLAMFIPLWTKSLGRGKTIIMPLVLIAALILNHDLIIHVGNHLIARFTERTGAGLGSQMGEDRLESSLFGIQHLLNPEWWVPRGSQEFIKRYGFLPHSTMTAVYLEGGIIGLLAWLVIFIFPLLMLGFQLLKRKLDPLASIVLIGGLASFAIQMSLYVPFLKHTWLWAGAVLGTLVRIQSNQSQTQEALSDEAPHFVATEPSWVRYARPITIANRPEIGEKKCEVPNDIQK